MKHHYDRLLYLILMLICIGWGWYLGVVENRYDEATFHIALCILMSITRRDRTPPDSKS